MPISAGPRPPRTVPANYSVQPMRHGKDGKFCCRVAVALEGTFFLVDADGMVDCFPSFGDAFSAGTRALLTIINKRIVLPKKNAPKALEIVPKLRAEESFDSMLSEVSSYD